MSSPNDRSDAPAAEFRRDLRGEIVIVSPGRARRPNDFRGDGRDAREICPFCPGREAETPPEIEAVRPPGSAPDTPGWSVRVFANRYPAFPREPDPANPRAAWGVHEVIVESPDHDRDLSMLRPDEVAAVLAVYQRRLRSARADPRIAYASIFKNRGAEAGASLEHPHSQLMALGFVPRLVAEEAEAQRRGGFERRMRAAAPIVESAALLAFAPAEARFPYELWLAPREQAGAFEEAPAAWVDETAGLLARLLGVMDALLGRPPYHLILRTAPFRGGAGVRWRVEIVPRLARVAGFELATGVFVNQTAPEDAARRYREALASAAASDEAASPAGVPAGAESASS